jgi:hypothetical protein
MMGETGGYGIEDIESIRSDQPAKVCAKLFHGGVGLAMLGCVGAWCELGRGGRPGLRPLLSLKQRLSLFEGRKNGDADYEGSMGVGMDTESG